jgi:hypothetical protein
MTFVAVIAIIAFVGLITAILMGVATVQAMIATGKGAAKMIDRPKIAALKIADTGKIVGYKLRDRALVIGEHVKNSSDSIAQIKRDVETVTKAFKG